MTTKIELEIPDTPIVGQIVTGVITAVGTTAPPTQPPTQPPVQPPVQPPASSWTPPANAVILGSIAAGTALMPNTGNQSKTLFNLGIMYAWQLGADARDAGFSCPSGTCTAGINGSYTAQGMDAAQVFGQIKAGDWLIVFLGAEDPPGSGNWIRHNVPAPALFSAH